MQRFAPSGIAPHPAAASASLGLAVTHLNAPAGSVLSEAQLTRSLRDGSVRGIADSPAAAALVSYLFVEVEPRLIAQCASDAGASLAQADLLYQESLRDGLPRVPAWEQAVVHLL